MSLWWCTVYGTTVVQYCSLRRTHLRTRYQVHDSYQVAFWMNAAGTSRSQQQQQQLDRANTVIMRRTSAPHCNARHPYVLLIQSPLFERYNTHMSTMYHTRYRYRTATGTSSRQIGMFYHAGHMWAAILYLLWSTSKEIAAKLLERR